MGNQISNKLKFSANLNFMFPEFPYIERFAQAKAAGFTAVELRVPDEGCTISRIKNELARHDLEMALYNFPVADFANTNEYFSHGAFGIWSNPSKRDLLWNYVDTAFHNASELKAKCIHPLVGNRIPTMSLDAQLRLLVENLKSAAPRAAAIGITLVVEVLNPYDCPDYLLTNLAKGLEVVRAVDEGNVKLLYDFYHAQQVRGDLTRTIKDNFELIGHIQFGDVPGRHEPGTGEINFKSLFKTLIECRYSKFVGAEYTPTRPTHETLDWMRWA